MDSLRLRVTGVWLRHWRYLFVPTWSDSRGSQYHAQLMADGCSAFCHNA